MTGMLKDVLHERADELGPPDLDLAAITSAGDRRARRRRTALVGGLAAASVLAALAVPAILAGGDEGPRRDLAADGTASDAQQLAWITGSTLHRPGRSDVDLGVGVRAWVWVGDAVAFTDAQHRVRLWTGDALDVIGTTAQPVSDAPELVSDGSMLAWVDRTSGRAVRYDVRDGTLDKAPPLSGRRPRVTTIDGPDVYAVDSAGVYVWRPASGSVGVVDPESQNAVMDAEGGTVVHGVEGDGLTLRRDGSSIEVATREFADLSPDGALLSIEKHDVGLVIDTSTGEETAIAHGHEWAVGYQWLGATTLAVLAFDGIDGDGAEQAWLLTCDGDTGACSVPGTEVPAGFGDFQLPIGVHFTG